MVIGAILTFPDDTRIVCCSVDSAPRLCPDGTVDVVSIPFLPLSEQAFVDSVVAEDGTGEPIEGFAEALADWQGDDRGLTTFTVPFDGYLDRLVARQMAEIMGRDAA